jgi:hypothetical protein
MNVFNGTNETDLMEQIPDFNNYMQLVEQKIKTMSDDILKRYSVEKLLAKTNIKELKNDHIIKTINTQDITIDSVKQRVQAHLEECSANQLNKILSKDPQRVKFTIELINPQQTLEAKSKPLPYHMKDKVRQTLREQEDAGLIRRSNSEWTSPLREVHKPDGQIRITVDYKPFWNFSICFSFKFCHLISFNFVINKIYYKNVFKI